MKKISEILKVAKFDDRDVESYFKKTEKEVIEIAQKSGKTFGVRDQPEPYGDKLNSYIGDFKSKCESMITFVDEKIQAQSHIPEYNSELKKVQEERDRIHKENTFLTQTINTIKIELGDLFLNDIKIRIRLLLAYSIILFVIETIFNAMGFEAFGEGIFVALLLSIGATLVIIITSFALGHYLRKAKDIKWQIIYIIIGLLFVFPIFYYLAVYRNNVLIREGINGIGIISFIIFNYAFFIITSFLDFTYWPTKDERKIYAQYKKLKAELAKKEKELKLNNEHITKLNHELNKKASHINHIIYYREYMVDRIIKLYHTAIALFIKYNILSRGDRKNPDCFNDVYPELNINNTFESILIPNNL